MRYDDQRLVVGEIFATLIVRAMLPAMRTAVPSCEPADTEPVQWLSPVLRHGPPLA